MEETTIAEFRGENMAEHRYSRISDIAGMTFGNVEVIELAEFEKGKQALWKCKCLICGKKFTANGCHLRSGRTKSCPQCRGVSHGLSYDRVYPVWQAIIRRCENPLSEHYDAYGGRGIKVCEEWHDPINFAKWAYSNGYDPNAKIMECTIERRDVNGDYCPENCYWTDQKTQSRNKRNNRRFVINGHKKTLVELSEETGINTTTITNRLKLGWTLERAISTPVQGHGRGNTKPILCLNDGIKHASLAEAANFYKISYDKLRRAVDKGVSVEGKVFESIKEK